MRGGLRSNESSRRGCSIAGSTSLGASTLAGVDTTTALATRLPVTAVGDDMGSLRDGYETDCGGSERESHLHARFTLDARGASSSHRSSQLCFGGRSRAQLALHGRASASIIALERRVIRVCRRVTDKLLIEKSNDLVFAEIRNATEIRKVMKIDAFGVHTRRCRLDQQARQVQLCGAKTTRLA